MIPSTPANNRHTPSSLIDTSLRIQPTVAATVTYFFITSRDRGTFNPPDISPPPRLGLLLLLLLLLLHPFNGVFSRTTWLSWKPKGKTSLDLNEAIDR